MASSSADPSAAQFESATPTNVRWVILLLLMATTGLSHFNRTSIATAGTEHIIKDYDLDKTQMGLVYSSYLIIYTLMMVPGGWLIERIGPKRALMVLGFGSALLVPFTSLAGYLIPSGDSAMWLGMPMIILTLCVVRGALGAVSAPLHPGAARAISFWFPYQTRGLGNGLVTGAALLGLAATPPVFGFLSDHFHFFSDAAGWKSAFLISGFAALLLSIIWTFYATDHPGQHPGVNLAERLSIDGGFSESVGAPREGAPEIGFWSLLLDRNMVLLNLSYAAYSYSQYLFFYWAQDYIKDVLKYGEVESRIWTSVVLLSMAAGMIGGGLMADRMQAIFGSRRGRAITPLFGMVGSGILLVFAVFSPTPLGTIAGFALSMGMLGLCEAPFWTTAVEIGQRRGALSGSILNAGGNVGGLLAPYVTPLFSFYFGWKAGLCLAGVICMLGGLFWLRIHLREVRPGVSAV